jgi:hypothetical protein
MIMNKIRFCCGHAARSRVAMAAVLAATTLFTPLVTHAATWTTTKVSNAPTGAYCAVSRAVDANTVITIGRSVRGQSSIALDQANVMLDPSQVMRVTIEPGNTSAIDIDTRPVNNRTLVLNFDQVVDLGAALSARPQVRVRYDGRDQNFQIPEWAKGQQDLMACVASLGERAPVARAQPVLDGPTAPAPRTVRAPITDDGRMVALAEENRQLRADLAAARRANDVAGQTVVAERDRLRSEVQTLTLDLDRLRAGQGAAATGAAAQTQRLETLSAEMAKATEENRTLKTQIEAMRAGTSASAELTALRAERDRLAQETVKLEQANKALQQQVTGQVADVATAKTLADQIAKLKVENETLQAKLAVTPAATGAGADTTKLEGQVEELKARLAVYADKPRTPAMSELQQRMEMLSAENVRLRADLAAATMPDTEVKVAVAAEAPLRQQIRTYRAQNQELEAKVEELSRLLDEGQRSEEKTLLGASGKNWDLERATRRLQETERDVQRLSLALRTNKSQCEAEKKQIEYMLFDPKLAKAGQIALLNSLEDQIAELRAIKGVAPTPMVARASTPVTVPSGEVVLAAVDAMADLSPATTAQSNVVDNLAAVMGAERPTADVAAESLPLAATMTASTENALPPGAVGFTRLLKNAGVALSKTMAPVTRNPFGPGKAWRFESGALAGLAVEQAAVKPESFDNIAKRQMRNLRGACKGDFAFQPALEETRMGLKYVAYDAACIHGADSTSAAVLFYQKNGAFSVISHEAAPDAMDKAMEARDKIISTLTAM